MPPHVRQAALAPALAAALLAGLGCQPCESVGVNLGATCLPAKVAAGQELSIEVQEACGTSCGEPPACTATVDINSVSLLVEQTECRMNCTPTGACLTRKATCRIGKLEAGDYTVVLPGLPSRTVTVEAGAATSCTLSP